MKHDRSVDLTRPGLPIDLRIVQGDARTHSITYTLYEGSMRWIIPDGTTAVIHYAKGDGTGGEYDKLPDGTEAIELNNNECTITLAEQVLTWAGCVRLQVTLSNQNGQQLSFWETIIKVLPNVAGYVAKSEDYISVTPSAIASELNDLRVDYTGKRHSKAGEAVREADKSLAGQIDKLKEDIEDFKKRENIISGKSVNMGYDYLKKNSLTSDFELNGNGNFKLLYFSNIADTDTNMTIEIGKTYLIMCEVSVEYSGNSLYSFVLGMRDAFYIDYAFNRLYPSGTWYPKASDTEIFTYGTITVTGNNTKAVPWLRISNAGDSANYKFTVKNWALVEYFDGMDINSLIEEFNKKPFTDIYKWNYEVRNIYCWGDSLTMGAGGNGTSYPSVLQSLIGNKYKVINMGVGGESGDTIACRQGGMVAYLDNDTTFTAGAATDFIAKTVYGVQIKPSRQVGSINGFILGNKGVIGWNDSSLSSTFTPENTFTAKKGTPIIVTQKMDNPFLQIICIGQNGVGNVNVNPQSENNYKTWCEVIDTMQNSTNAITIVLSLLEGGASYNSTVDLYAQKKYGSRYIESRQELSKYGLSIVDITPSSEDIENMNSEKVPKSLFSDSVHLNDKGYTAWATIIYWHLKGMNLIN